MHTNQCLTRITRANRANTHVTHPPARATYPLPVTYIRINTQKWFLKRLFIVIHKDNQCKKCYKVLQLV